MTAAQSLAVRGFKVTIVERAEQLGGLLNKINRIFPGDIPAEELITEKIKNVGLGKSEETFNVKDKTPEIPKRKSILSMTKGFLQNIKDEGNDWSKRNGDDNKKPSIEDLKEESYNQRIHWCFQNETRILNIHMPLDEKRNMYQGFKINPIIFFILNEDGKINELNIVRSSGSRKLDVYVLKAFKGASPYPPIPKHLNRKTYVGRRKILMHR